MIKTKIALGALLMAFVLAPAGAARDSHKPAAKASAKSGAKSGVKTGVKKAGGASRKAGKAAGPVKSARKPDPLPAAGQKKPAAAPAAAAAAAAAAVAAPLAAAPAPASPERRGDRSLGLQTGQFLTALWRIDPEGAIAAGKFDTAAGLSIPDAAGRAQQLAFAEEWLARFGKFEARQLSPRQRADLALLTNKLEAQRWNLTVWREFEWNPALYNIAGPIDAILHTEYASQPQRLRTLLRRIAHVPAYYEAARASIVNPTREHTALAIEQGATAGALLAELDRVAQASILTASEKQLYSQRVGAARAALDAYTAWLGELDKTLGKNGARSFRIGKELYQQKFAYEIQAAGDAEQMYQAALLAREQLLIGMNNWADELWGKTMGAAARPDQRNEKIGLVLAQLAGAHVARAELLPEIRRQIPLLQEWVGSHNLLALDPGQAPLVRALPPYRRAVADAALAAPGPYRPQDRGYVNVAAFDDDTPEQAESRLRDYNRWTLPLAVMHETIPGHFAQQALANKSPSIVKALFANRAMTEGWAVYGERMMLESGWGDNTPEMWLMYSKWHLRSITDAILDYSVHALGMTREQAFELLTRQAFQSPREAAQAWRRVQLSSVQLCGGFSGYSEIMALREQRRQAQGAAFALKAFHQQLLAHGSAPVRLIKELMQ